MHFTPLIDTHCHLNLPPLASNLPAALAKAQTCGVTDLIIPAYDRASWSAINAITNTVCPPAPRLHPAYGLHPWVAPAAGDHDAMADLSLCARQANTVAIGEIGLDTKYRPANAAVLADQITLLDAQLQLAVDLDLPVMLHCRGAVPELLNALANHRGRVRGVLHGFSRGPEVGEQFIAAGLYLGLGGVITRANAHRARRAAVHLPLSRLVLETDAPDSGLAGVPPGATQPCHLGDVATALAGLRGETRDRIAAVTTANTRDLFKRLASIEDQWTNSCE